MEQNPDAGTQTPDKIDIERLMAEIRSKVQRDLEDSHERSVDYRPHQARSDSDAAVPVLYSEELNYLNANWGNWYEPVAVSSHRLFLGKVLVKLKTKLRDWAWQYLLRDYCERERQYQMNLVRFLNATARYIDARDAHVFWELVHKVDNDVRGLNTRANQLYDEAMGTARTLNIALSNQEAAHDGNLRELGQLGERIKTVEELIRGLERTTSLIGSACAPLKKSNGSSSQAESPAAESRTGAKKSELLQHGVDYLLLENRYRGSEEVIRGRLERYVPLFAEVNQPILDLGCGRGEFLELLKSKGKQALGIDLDLAMVERCREKDLRVERADVLGYLTACSDHSVGGIFCAQLVEHLTRAQLEQLFTLIAKKVVSGGPVVLETVNPQSVTALCRNFFRDLTHVWPLHPDTLQYMLELKGIKTVDVIYSSPYPGEVVLREIPVTNDLPPHWRFLLQSMNDNVRRLNDLLFGFQDYAICGLNDGTLEAYRR